MIRRDNAAFNFRIVSCRASCSCLPSIVTGFAGADSITASVVAATDAALVHAVVAASASSDIAVVVDFRVDADSAVVSGAEMEVGAGTDSDSEFSGPRGPAGSSMCLSQ